MNENNCSHGFRAYKMRLRTEAPSDSKVESGPSRKRAQPDFRVPRKSLKFDALHRVFRIFDKVDIEFPQAVSPELSSGLLAPLPRPQEGLHQMLLPHPARK